MRHHQHYRNPARSAAAGLPAAALFTEDGLSQIPADKQVVVYCYTGHTAAQATAMLNLLGYDAYSLKYGFCSWSPTSVKCFSDAASDQERYAINEKQSKTKGEDDERAG